MSEKIDSWAKKREKLRKFCLEIIFLNARIPPTFNISHKPTTRYGFCDYRSQFYREYKIPLTILYVIFVESFNDGYARYPRIIMHIPFFKILSLYLLSQ